MSSVEPNRSRQVFDQNKVFGFITELEHNPKAKQRPYVIGKAMDYMLSDPIMAMKSFALLVDRRGNKDAELLINNLQVDKIIEHLENRGKVPRKEDFAEVISQLNGEAGEFAEAILAGYLTRPIGVVQEAGKDSGKLQRAAVMANRVALDFTEALYENKSYETRRRTLEIFDKYVINRNPLKSNLIDLLIINKFFAQPYGEAVKADVILYALNTISSFDADKNIFQSYLSAPPSPSMLVQLSKIAFLEIRPGKEPNLVRIWGKQSRHVHVWDKDFRTAVEKFSKSADQILSGEAEIFIDDPAPYVVGNEAQRRVLRFMGEGLRMAKLGPWGPRLNYSLLCLPGGRTMMIYGDEREINTREVRLRVADKIAHAVYAISTKAIYKDLKAEELENIIEYLKPREIDPVKIAQLLPVAMEEAQAGLHAISKRGTSNELNLAEEEYLREMGLSKISFFRTEQGTRVTTVWGSTSFTFYIDKLYRPVGLESLSDENRNILMAIIFSYLKAVKNPEESRMEYIESEEERSEPEVEVEVERTTSGKRDLIARAPYLRVLPRGDKSHKIGHDKTEAQVDEIWGIGLGQLNAIFLEIQADYSLWIDPSSWINKELDSSRRGKQLRNLINRIIANTMKKEERPVWREMQINGKTRTVLAPKVLPTGWNINYDVYRVTYVDETEVVGATPRVVKCPGVALALKEAVFS